MTWKTKPATKKNWQSWYWHCCVCGRGLRYCGHDGDDCIFAMNGEAVAIACSDHFCLDSRHKTPYHEEAAVKFLAECRKLFFPRDIVSFFASLFEVQLKGEKHGLA